MQLHFHIFTPVPSMHGKSHPSHLTTAFLPPKQMHTKLEHEKSCDTTTRMGTPIRLVTICGKWFAVLADLSPSTVTLVPYFKSQVFTLTVLKLDDDSLMLRKRPKSS